MSQPSSSNASLQDPPAVPPDSPGSSVSTRLQEEYDELLKYAVVVPDYNPKDVRGKLTDSRGVFSHEDGISTMKPSQRAALVDELQEARRREAEDEEEERTPRANSPGGGVKHLPDFGQSPIDSHVRSSLSDQLREGSPDDVGGGRPFAQTSFPEPGSMREEMRGRGHMEDIFTATIDYDVGKMETLMDEWCLDLKRNVLAEFAQAKIVVEQRCRQELLKEMNRHASEKASLIKELDNLKELLHTYEQSLERKDSIISNLTSAVYRQRDKIDLMRNFCNWRIQHNDAKRESFAFQLARKHHERSLSRRVLSAWFSIIHSKWRQRVERACQVKAQEVCMQVTADYEAKIASLNEAQESMREEVRRLHVQREHYEEAMKKAFMRGVCALNMEAMSMFHGDEAAEADPRLADQDNGDDYYSDNLDSNMPEKGPGAPKSIPQDAVRSSVPADAHPPKVVTSQGSRSMPANTMPRQTSAKQTSSSTATQKSRLVTRAPGKGHDPGRTAGRSLSPSLQPPMASVVVERHHPVNKQTIGHATALRYAKPAGEQEKFRRLAGQETIGKAPPIQTVRVVE